MEAPRAALAVLLGVVLLASACGKEKTPKVEPKIDPAVGEAARAAIERSHKDVFGPQLKALDTAKGLEAGVNAKAQDSVDRIEKDAK